MGQNPKDQGLLSDLVAVDEEQEQLARVGVDLLNRLFVLTRNTLLFNLNNEALVRPVTAFLESLGQLKALRERNAAIGIVGDNVFINKSLLKPDPSTYKNSQFLARIYRKLMAQEFQFSTEATRDDLQAFMETLRHVIDGKADPELLLELRNFQLTPLSKADAVAGDTEIDSRIQVLRVFAGSIAMMTRIMALAFRGMPWSPSQLRRVAYDLSDAAGREPDLLCGLMHLPVGKSRLGAHLVRTAILTLVSAQQLGLPRKGMAEAALIALCHHLSHPSEEAFLADELSADGDEGDDVRRDPLSVALALCPRGGLNEGLIRRVVGVYESSSKELSQTELYSKSRPDDLLGRLISICDRYVTIQEFLQPDEALRLVLVEKEGAEPALSRLIVRAIGLYPVGTVVKLSTGETAVVVKAPRRSQQLLQPVVQIVDAEGGGGLVDLSQGNRGRIVGTLIPQREGINVSHMFLL